MFYDILFKFYELIFPKNFTIYNFLNSYIINQPSNILDIACGTGEYSIEFAQKGHKVFALDNNSNMIDKARSKALLYSLLITFDVIDMMSLNIYNLQFFDLIFVIGNSISHLNSIDEVKIFIKNVNSLLKDNAYFVVHSINYDNPNILSPKFFPLIQRGNIEFIRYYSEQNNFLKLNFNTIINVYNENINLEDNFKLNKEIEQKEIKTYKNTIEHLIIHKEELQKILEANFSEVKLYGDYNHNDYTINSQSMIFVCKK